jgi:YegS/Rv2252/BmrU family lipid kinase
VPTCVIFNPVARGDKARHFRQHLDALGHVATLLQTSGPGDATRLAAQAVRAGFDTLVAAGGDGTLNEVVNGLAGAPGGLAGARLGLLPLGTVNVFARELAIPQEFAPAWQVILRGHETRVDLPHARWATAGVKSARWFCQLAGAGLDARAIELVDWSLKKKVGPLAYVLAGFEALGETQTQISVQAGDRVESGALVLLGNGRLYGGDFALFPDADLRDGLLEVCIFPRVHLGTLARVAPQLLACQRLPEGAVRRLRAPVVTLTASGGAFQVDGEWAGHLPVTFALESKGLRVIVP